MIGILIDRFQCEKIIFGGVAEALSEEMQNPPDLILGTLRRL